MRGLVIGSAECVWQDIENAGQFGPFDGVIAVKDMGALYPGEIDIWASLHPERFPKQVEDRAANGFPPARRYACHLRGEGEKAKQRFNCDIEISHLWGGDQQFGSGSSGLFAIKAAFFAGYDDLVLCGIPMDADAGHITRHKPWIAAGDYRRGWVPVLPQLHGRVTSMSGWTRAMLGGPKECST